MIAFRDMVEGSMTIVPGAFPLPSLCCTSAETPGNVTVFGAGCAAAKSYDNYCLSAVEELNAAVIRKQMQLKKIRCCGGYHVARVSPLPGQAQAQAQVHSWQGSLHLMRLLAQQASCAELAAPLGASEASHERCRAKATGLEQPCSSSILSCPQRPNGLQICGNKTSLSC